MKSYTKGYIVHSNSGGVLVGNEQFGVVLPNIGGDGNTIVDIYEDETEMTGEERLSLQFVTRISGTFNIYSHDCADRDNPLAILTTISGEYGVYRGPMRVVLEKWED